MSARRRAGIIAGIIAALTVTALAAGNGLLRLLEELDRDLDRMLE